MRGTGGRGSDRVADATSVAYLWRRTDWIVKDVLETAGRVGCRTSWRGRYTDRGGGGV